MATLLEELGGRPAIELVVASFYEKVLADPLLKGYFRGVQMSKLYKNQADFFCAALGQPDAYRGRDMRTVHAGMNIGDAEFDAVAGHLVQTLTEMGVDQEKINQVVSLIAPLRSEIVTRPPEPQSVTWPKAVTVPGGAPGHVKGGPGASAAGVCPVHAAPGGASGWVWSLVALAVILVAAVAGIVVWQGGQMLH
jgi:hemoglobin